MFNTRRPWRHAEGTDAQVYLWCINAGGVSTQVMPQRMQIADDGDSYLVHFFRMASCLAMVCRVTIVPSNNTVSLTGTGPIILWLALL